MPPVPILKVRVVLRILESHGFQVLSQRGQGSHRFMQHPDGRTTTLSGKSGEDVPRGRLSKMLRDTKLTVDDFTKR